MRKLAVTGVLALLLTVGSGDLAVAQVGSPADPAASAADAAGGFDHWGLLGLLGLVGLVGSVRARAAGMVENHRLRKDAKQGMGETAYAKLRADELRRVAAEADEKATGWTAEPRPEGPTYPAWSTASNHGTEQRPRVSSSSSRSGVQPS
jgi:hypothetical protein